MTSSPSSVGRPSVLYVPLGRDDGREKRPAGGPEDSTWH
jgi:hypothetical protein